MPCHSFYLLSILQDLTQSHAGLQTTKALCYCVMDGFFSFHFPCDKFLLISCAFSSTNIWRLIFLGIPMRHFWNGMFLTTLKGELYKTVSVQLSSRDWNQNKIYGETTDSAHLQCTLVYSTMLSEMYNFFYVDI